MMKKAFASIPDSRRKTKGNYRYQLSDIVILIVIGYLRGCNTMTELYDFVQGEKTFIKEQCKLFSNVDELPSLSILYRLSENIDKDKLKDESPS